MTLKSWFLLISAIVVLLVVVGCGSPPATPTKPPVTIPPAVVTVIVTAPPPPATATAVTPPTAAPTVTATVAVTTPVAVKATAVPVARTRTPTRVAATTAPTALPQKFAAPRPIEPIFIDEQGARKDERHFPADALKFKWTSVGGLGGDECYMLTIAMTPGQGDSFLVDCGDQSQLGLPVVNPVTPDASFTLYQPNRGGPNYSALLPNPNSDTWVSWSVVVVKDLGKGTGPQDVGGTRHNVAPLGPSSARVQFLLKGQ